jgi:hypothetical protein
MLRLTSKPQVLIKEGLTNPGNGARGAGKSANSYHKRKPDRDNSDVSKSMDRGLLRNFSAMDQISRIGKLQK